MTGGYSDLMVGYAKDKPKPETHLLSVGRHEDRIETLGTIRKLAERHEYAGAVVGCVMGLCGIEEGNFE